MKDFRGVELLRRGTVATLTIRRPVQRHDLYGRVSDLTEKAIDYRAVQQHVPSRTSGLSEDHVRDPLVARKLDQRVGNSSPFQLDYITAQLFGEANVLLQHSMGVRIDPARFVAWRFYVHSDPIRRQAARDARARSQDAFGAIARRHCD